MNQEQAYKKRIIISGGGTGGHLFPALAIAQALQAREPDIAILFVGAKGKIEEKRVPEAGYPIELLPVRGFPRKLSLNVLRVLKQLASSVQLSRRIVKQFQPHAVIGVGGYASGPVGWVASHRGIPLFLQEQNSYAGLTNRWLGKRAAKAFVAYDRMERFFPANRVMKTGNPVRSNLLQLQVTASEARKHFGLPESIERVILIVGGSGGARSMNEAVMAHLNTIDQQANVGIIWQTGNYYYPGVQEALAGKQPENLFPMAFINRMDMAYALADLVITRSGAGTIAELGVLGQPALFVPSPNVADDHQKKNALALVEKGAAQMIEDHQAKEKLINQALAVVSDGELLQVMAQKIKPFGYPGAADTIAREVLTHLSNQKKQ